MSLRLTDIDVTYGRDTAYAARALEGVSLEVEPGRLVLVLGETGSGKSTLLRVASGLLAADAGSADIDGSPLDATSSRGRVGLVFQDAESQLFAETVIDDVAFGPRNLGSSTAGARAAAEAALEAVGLDAERFAHRSPFTLSGGEARRVAVAGALAMSPDYLLLDEPTAGLDVRGRRLLLDAILRLREQAGIVVVSHNAEEFLPYADRVVVLAAGRVVWTGAGNDLVDRLAQSRDAEVFTPAVLEAQRLASAACGREWRYLLDPADAARAIMGRVG